MTVSSPISYGPLFSIDVSVKVTNSGDVTGSEVVQVYITPPDIGLTTPSLQLRGFTKAKNLWPGQSRVVTVHLDKYAVSYWDTRRTAWVVKAGKYWVAVGKSSEDIVLRGQFELKSDFEWSGL